MCPVLVTNMADMQRPPPPSSHPSSTPSHPSLPPAIKGLEVTKKNHELQDLKGPI